MTEIIVSSENNLVPELEFVVALDTSGSMPENIIRKFLKEITHFLSKYNNFKLYVCCFDVEVRNIKFFTPDNIHELSEYTFESCGGTSLFSVLDWIYKDKINPTYFFVLSDGYFSDAQENPSAHDRFNEFKHGRKTILVLVYGEMVLLDFDVVINYTEKLQLEYILC